MNEAELGRGYSGSAKTLDARQALVLDFETMGRKDVGAYLRTEEKLAAVNDMQLDELLQLAAREEISLGNAKKFEAVHKAITNYYMKREATLALKPYGCEIASIACHDVAGADEDAIAMRKDGVEPDWTGCVWTVDENSTERDVILNFMSYLESFDTPPVLMGFNIRGRSGGWSRGFDIPIWRIRCLMLDIHWPAWLPSSLSQDRWWPRLWDLMDVFGEGSCDDWLRACGLPLKMASGSDVENMSPDELRIYNADDAAKERLLCGVVLPSQPSPYCDLL